MNRRRFLALTTTAAALWALRAHEPFQPQVAHAAADRLTWWRPAPSPRLPPNLVVLEWRYLAGRVTRDGQDFGFVLSISDYNQPLSDSQELLVTRQDFTGERAYSSKTYSGTLRYDAASATYSFTTAAEPTVQLTWRLDTIAQRYTLDLKSPELTLSGLTLVPQGSLISEGGDGEVKTGDLGGVEILSDYYADWVRLEAGGQAIGYARLDMQTIRPSGVPSGTAVSFSHHWFALAARLADNTPVWLSAWQIVSGGSTVWTLTVARGSGSSWSISSLTEASSGLVQPLTLAILDWQAQPSAANLPSRRTGKRWRINVGATAANDQLALEIAVPPGQFISGGRFANVSDSMQEAIGLDASGSIGGQAIAAVSFAIAESTYAEADPVVTPTPSTSPTVAPSTSPTADPSASPTAVPSTSPTADPSASPTLAPSTSPTPNPSVNPTPATPVPSSKKLYLPLIKQ